MRNASDPYDKRIDLPSAIRETLEDAGLASFRVVALPAGAITEMSLDDDARVIRQGAHYRLKEGRGYQGALPSGGAGLVPGKPGSALPHRGLLIDTMVS